MALKTMLAALAVATLPGVALADAVYTMTDDQNGSRGKLIYEVDLGADAIFIHDTFNDRIYVEGYANSGPNQNRFNGFYVSSDPSAPPCSETAQDHQGNVWQKWGYVVFHASPDRSEVAVEFKHCGVGNLFSLYGLLAQ